MSVYSPASAAILDRFARDLPQGILLSGPGGIGLGTAAHEVARHHSHDVVTLTPDEKGTISIDAVRELYTVGRSRGTGRVFVINDADAMGVEAQNALLKLLEEPGEAIRFILTSHDPDRLLPTVRSRVGQYALTPISRTQSEVLLDSLKVADQTKRAQLLFIAEGLPAALSRYATTPKAFANRSATIRDARGFIQGTREQRLVTVAGYKERGDALALIGDMLKLARRGAETQPERAALGSIDALLDAEASLGENGSVRLTLTNLALAL